MAEKELDHRHKIEKSCLDSTVTVEAKGLIFAFSICLLVIARSIGLIALGYSITGGFFSEIPLVGLAYIFITGRRRKSTESSS